MGERQANLYLSIISPHWACSCDARSGFHDGCVGQCLRLPVDFVVLLGRVFLDPLDVVKSLALSLQFLLPNLLDMGHSSLDCFLLLGLRVLVDGLSDLVAGLLAFGFFQLLDVLLVGLGSLSFFSSNGDLEGGGSSLLNLFFR